MLTSVSARPCARARIASAALTAALLLASPAFADAPLPRFEGLKPGEFVTHDITVPVRIVLIGFDQLGVDQDTIRSILPASYEPLVRYPQFYGLAGRALGLRYGFEHSIVQKDARFANRFFAHLVKIGQEGPRTAYQAAYNDQVNNVLDVPETVLLIDAPSVERWLQANDRQPQHGYTIYLVNWYGREDFRFHVYTKTDEPDPDTGYNFGALRSSRKIVSWGGTTSRRWFYDFSAGPEYTGGNWNVDDEDIDGDGSQDNRIPVVWEYAETGYRKPEELSFDMGLLARFVAINLLFTPSPLYDPLVTAPDVLGRKTADVTMFEDGGEPAEKGISFFDPRFARARLGDFQPYYRWRVNLRGIDPIDDGAKRSLDIFSGNLEENDCWTAYGTPFAQLFCYFDANRARYVPAYHDRDYVAPVFSFNTTDAGLGSQSGLLGFSDDNWLDGRQSFVFTFGAPAYRAAGYGFTATTVHEVGHHIGLSHPHDGYDSELGADYGPNGFLQFAWLGDESDTVMHYLALSNTFGVHNRDNMYRWEAAGYLNWSNALAADILASPDARKVGLMLIGADRLALRATRALTRWDYLDAVTDARQAYGMLSAAAELLGVRSSRLAMARRALPPERIQKYVCRPRPVAN